MPKIDFVAVATPNFIRPELLRHHTIPQPMFGTAPRVIMGQKWWDETRRAAYIANNMRCWACGGEGPLEAHEAYDIIMEEGRMIYLETTSLCTDCHAFIHIGRTIGLLARGEIAPGTAKRVVLKGYEHLKKAGLKCPYETAIIDNPRLPWKGSTTWIRRVIKNTDSAPYWRYLRKVPWSEWRLVFEGKEYPPRFDSRDHYMEETL